MRKESKTFKGDMAKIPKDHKGRVLIPTIFRDKQSKLFTEGKIPAIRGMVRYNAYTLATGVSRH